MVEATGICSKCKYMWVTVSIQPCRSCKECSAYGGTEDNFEEKESEL